MSVVSCRETFPRRSGEFRAVGGETTLRRHFRVKTSSMADDENTIMASGELPAPGQRHPARGAAIADRFTFDQFADSGFLWDVVIEYTTVSGGTLPQAQPFDPTVRLPEISWDGVQFRKPVLRAALLDGPAGSPRTPPDYPLCNSAGVPYNPPLEKDDSRPTATVVRNLLVCPPWILDYQDAVNSDTFTLDGITVQPYYAKMNAVRVSGMRFENGFFFRSVTMVVQLNRQSWDEGLLDAGHEELLEAESDPVEALYAQRRKIVDASGLPVTEDRLLDGKGRAMPEGSLPSYRYYRVYDNPRPFSPLFE